MPRFWSNVFDNATLQTVEPSRRQDTRGLSTMSLEEPQLNWHETILFAPGSDLPRRRRASSVGEVPQDSIAHPQVAIGLAPRSANTEAFNLRTPSVIDARANGFGRKRQRQASVAGARRPSTSERRTSFPDRRGISGRRPSVAVTGPENRSRQPSVFWARQSSILIVS